MVRILTANDFGMTVVRHFTIEELCEQLEKM
jgi:hypothetical protein